MKQPILTYALTTKNKLEFLKRALPRLVKNVRGDEEVVVVDGGSTDGSAEFLRTLYQEERLNYFISEPDKGEAHALNKAVLASRGKLVKFITDDDVYYYPGIRKCRKFMLGHPEIDALGTDGAGTDWSRDNPFVPFGETYDRRYRLWKKAGQAFSFCGLGLMIRRSSLSLTGLFDPNFTRVDAEFTLRLTSGRVNLGWYTGDIYVRLTNPHSISVTKSDRVEKDTRFLNILYPDQEEARKSDENHPSLLGRVIREGPKQNNVRKMYENPQNAWKLCENWLVKTNRKSPGMFLYK